MKQQSFPPALPRALAALLCGLLSCAAMAEPITPFNDALLTWHSPDTAPDFFASQTDRKLQTAGGPLAAASTTYSGGGDWGSVSGMAAADLAAGTLKSRATLNFVNPPDSLLYLQSNAKFGDGFRTTTAGGTQPFNWTLGTGARFSMHVDGSINSTNPLGGSSDPGAFLILALLQPGTLTPSQNPLAGANLIRYYAYFLGNPNIGLQSCYLGSCVPVVPEATYLDLTGGVDIVQNITPGSDFDWQIIMGSAGWLYTPGSYDFDFSHTVTVGYQGPAGALTQSVSGIFPGTLALPVPEPTTWSLMGLGLLGLLALRKHRPGLREPRQEPLLLTHTAAC